MGALNAAKYYLASSIAAAKFCSQSNAGPVEVTSAGHGATATPSFGV
jgi:hypothetical protein